MAHSIQTIPRSFHVLPHEAHESLHELHSNEAEMTKYASTAAQITFRGQAHLDLTRIRLTSRSATAQSVLEQA